MERGRLQHERNDQRHQLKLVSASEVRRVTTDPAPDVSPAWSPDGRLIAFVRERPAAAGGATVQLDTGTIPSMLDQRIARKLPLHAEPSQLVAFGQAIGIHSVALAGLRLGPIAPDEVSAGICDLSYLHGTQIDGIVGLDVLAHTSFGIDYRTHRLSFGPAARESAVVPMQIVWPFLTVRLSLGKEPMQLLVDTGSRDLVLFKSRMSASMPPIRWKGEKVVQHASGAAHLLRYDLNQVALGGERWNSLPGFVLDASTAGYPPGIDGVLGVRALGSTRVRFDFERRELGWSR